MYGEVQSKRYFKWKKAILATLTYASMVLVNSPEVMGGAVSEETARLVANNFISYKGISNSIDSVSVISSSGQ